MTKTKSAPADAVRLVWTDERIAETAGWAVCEATYGALLWRVIRPMRDEYEIVLGQREKLTRLTTLAWLRSQRRLDELQAALADRDAIIDELQAALRDAEQAAEATIRRAMALAERRGQAIVELVDERQALRAQLAATEPPADGYEQLLARHEPAVETDEGECVSCHWGPPCRQRMDETVVALQAELRHANAFPTPAALLAWLQRHGYSSLTHGIGVLADLWLEETKGGEHVSHR